MFDASVFLSSVIVISGHHRDTLVDLAVVFSIKASIKILD